MLSDSAIKEAAAQTSLDVEAVEETLSDLQEAIADELYTEYKRALTGSGARRLLHEDRDMLVFAFDRGRIARFLDAPAHSDTTRAAEIAHLYQAQYRHKFGVSVSLTRVSNLKEAYQMYVPVFIDYPDDWQTAQSIGVMRMLDLFQYGLTPAEAVDYWLFERQHTDIHELGGLRDVEYESMKKNISRAQNKLQDEDNAPYYEVNDIRTVNLSDIDGPESLPEDRKLFVYDEIGN